MSWDGLYMNERYYPNFDIGDEVQLNNYKRYRFLSKDNYYTVIECFNPYPHLGDKSNARKIKILNDGGFISEYATYNFKKSDRQLREDKLREILD
jgi:hypothetical protein